jgi:diguanylate cyclase (GGDEF)-like protein/PAS domain S-box-containing protein
MKDDKKTKVQLIHDLVELRKSISDLEKSVNECKKIEKALKESEVRYKALFDRSLFCVYIHDFEGRFMDANDAALHLLGYTREEIPSITFSTLVGEDQLPEAYARMQELLQIGVRKGPHEYTLRKKNGELVWVETEGSLIYKEGKPHAILGIARDITERKRIENELLESEKRYRSIVEDQTELICRFSPDETLTFVNEAYCRYFNKHPEELLGKNFLTLIPEEDHNRVRKHFSALTPENPVATYDHRVLASAGDTRWQQWTNRALFDNQGCIIEFQSVGRDITERKHAEEALRESEERFKAKYKGIPIPTYTWQKINNDFVLVDYNYAAEQITQGGISHWIGVKLSEMYKDMPQIMDDMWHCYNKKTIIRAEMPYKFKSINKEGIFTAHYSYAPPDFILVHTEDITDRKDFEKALRESEEKYRTLFEDSRDAIYMTTPNGEYLDVNQATLDLFGYTREEMLKLNARQLYADPNDREKFKQEIEQRGSVRNYETKFRKKDGTDIYCLVTATLRKSIDGTVLGHQGMIRDITELKRVENQLRYLSLHDPLTGLYNRAYFEEEMCRIESSRYKSVGIIMCDVDGLKFVNDALGHHEGDKLLLATAGILKESFRGADVVARVGGDEFAVLLPDSDPETLKIATQRIRDTVKHYNVSSPGLPLSISLGHASNTEPPTIINNLFKEADNNMYREKLHNSLSARSTIVQTLMKALETRDSFRDGHVKRLLKLVNAFAVDAGLQDQTTTDLHLLAEFHDIGKVGISSDILFKTDPLTPEESHEMKKHCEIGHRIALCTPDLLPIADLILKHHEWWDGKGYPFGIKGNHIPLECRILAVAEAYEAMTRDLVYHHKALSHEEALYEIQRYAGTRFDPDIASKFIGILKSAKNPLKS